MNFSSESGSRFRDEGWQISVFGFVEFSTCKADAPRCEHICRGMSAGSALVGPVQETACGIGAKKMPAWQNTHAAEIETIGVPARLNGRVGLGETIGVQAAGFVEEIKPRVVEMHKRASQGMGEISPAQAMAPVDRLIHPPRIVEEGEKFHHLEIGSIGFGNPATILHHPRPVEDAMRAGFSEGVLAQDCREDGAVVVHEGERRCRAAKQKQPVESCGLFALMQ